MKHSRRIFAGISAAAMLCSAMPLSTSAAELLRGDFDGSGDVSAADAQLLLQAYTNQLAGLPDNLTAEQKSACDIDGSGKADVADAQLILNYYVVNVVTGKATTWEELLAPPKSNDETAGELIRKYLDDAVKGDYDAMLSVSNYPLAAPMLNDTITDEESMKAAFQKSFKQPESYELGEIIPFTEGLEDYNKRSEQMREQGKEKLSELDDEQTRRIAEQYIEFLQPIDSLYRVPVTITHADKTEKGNIYVYLQKGKWYVDANIISAFFDYIRASKIATANRGANTIMNAFQIAYSQLRTLGVDAAVADGEYYFKGKDFENPSPVTVNANSSKEDVLAAMKYYAAEKYSKELIKLEDVAVRLKDGMPECAAASVEIDGVLWFGMTPNAADRHAEDSELCHDIQSALAAAGKSN